MANKDTSDFRYDPAGELTRGEMGIPDEPLAKREHSYGGRIALGVAAISAAVLGIPTLVDAYQKSERDWRADQQEVAASMRRDGLTPDIQTITLPDWRDGYVTLTFPGCEMRNVAFKIKKQGGKFVDTYGYSVNGTAYPGATDKIGSGTDTSITGVDVTFRFDSATEAGRLFGGDICRTLAQNSHIGQ